MSDPTIVADPPESQYRGKVLRYLRSVSSPDRLAGWKNTRQIADALGLSVRTVYWACSWLYDEALINRGAQGNPNYWKAEL